MEKYFLFFVCTSIIFMTSCSNDNRNEANDQLTQKLDSIQNELSLLRDQLSEKNKKDSNESKVAPEIQQAKDTLKKIREKEKVVVEKTKVTPVKEQVKENIIKHTEEDTIFYYYKNSKKVSALFTPWKDMRRKLMVFSPTGTLTYEQEDVRMSYSSHTEIKGFHSNGAISVIHIHLNPGASMYWYETSITFGIDNEPEWKTDMKHPSTLEEQLNSKSWWDKKEKKWKKQEYIREQPVPQN